MAMKNFKVGDYVKVIFNETSDKKFIIGRIARIEEISDNMGLRFPFIIRFINESLNKKVLHHNFGKKELKLATEKEAFLEWL